MAPRWAKAIVVARVFSFPQSVLGMATVLGLYRRFQAVDGISRRRHVRIPAREFVTERCRVIAVDGTGSEIA
jgi:hypothetical protein